MHAIAFVMLGHVEGCCVPVQRTGLSNRVVMQIGEIKKGLKAFKTCGVSDYDYQRHIMFVQVLQTSPCDFYVYRLSDLCLFPFVWCGLLRPSLG